MTYKPLGSPDCFGSPTLWSPTAVECIGGMDQGYTNPITKSHKRDKCIWYSQCAATAAAVRSEPKTIMSAHPTVFAQPPAVPAPTGFHPIQPQHSPTNYGRGPVAPVQPYQPMYLQHAQQAPQPQQALASPQQLVPPWMAQYGPQLVPIVFQQQGMQMPSYLTVPEPVDPNEHWTRRLLRELFRSMLKSSGHTAASFFDHNPFRPYSLPETTAPPPPAPPAR